MDASVARALLFVAVLVNAAWAGLLALWYLLTAATAGTPGVLLDAEQSTRRTQDMLTPRPFFLVPTLVLLVLFAIWAGAEHRRFPGASIATHWTAVAWYATTTLSWLVVVAAGPNRRTGDAELRSLAILAVLACLLQLAGLIVLATGVARTRRRLTLTGNL